jgi:hypothetical protein
MKVPDSFSCEECGAIWRELREAAAAEVRAVQSSDRDLYELRREWLHADPSQTLEMAQSFYPRTMAARRRRTEHEILTGHNILTHGWRSAWFDRRS